MTNDGSTPREPPICGSITVEFEWSCCTNFTITVGQRNGVTAVTFFPARPRPDQRGTNTVKYAKFPWMKSRVIFVYRLDETISQLSANNGILWSLVREIWQFKVFAGKEVTVPPATRGEEGLLTVRKKVTVLVMKLISFVFFKTLQIKLLCTYHRLVILNSKHI